MTISELLFGIGSELERSKCLCIFFCCSVDFCKGSTTIESLYDTVLLERDHTIEYGCFIDDDSTCTIDDEFFDTIGDLEDLIDTDSTLVPYIITLRTAYWLIKCRFLKYISTDSRKKLVLSSMFEGFFDTSFEVCIELIHSYRFFAMLTEFAYEALRDDRIDRCRQEKCRDSHIQNTCQSLSRRVRMDRRDYKVTCQSCFYGDIYRFMISDFSYHDDVWVLTQSSTKSECEVVSDIWEHL